MGGEAATVPTNRVVLEAIATRHCLRARYNNQTIVLAPHILYTRHGAPYLDAVTVEREGAPPREVKVSSFKLDGLHDITAETRAFVPDTRFDPHIERYRGQTLFAV